MLIPIFSSGGNTSEEKTPSSSSNASEKVDDITTEKTNSTHLKNLMLSNGFISSFFLVSIYSSASSTPVHAFAIQKNDVVLFVALEYDTDDLSILEDDSIDCIYGQKTRKGSSYKICHVPDGSILLSRDFTPAFFVYKGTWVEYSYVDRKEYFY